VFLVVALRKYEDKALVLVGLGAFSRLVLKKTGPKMGRHAATTDMQGSIDPQMMVLIVVTAIDERKSWC
jgi:hypothetical protein